MGFWSTVGGLAKGAAENVQVKITEANVLAEDYRREDDDYLKEKVKRGRPIEKMAAAKVLKERGYGSGT